MAANLEGARSILPIGWYEVNQIIDNGQLQMEMMMGMRQLQHPNSFCSKQCIIGWIITSTAVEATSENS